MTRCLVRPGDWGDDPIVLPPGQAHHLRDVLRARPGDRVELADGAGRLADGEVAEVSPGRVSVRALCAPQAAASGVEVVLAQAIPKGQRMDLIVEKAGELGAAAVLPMAAARCVVRLSEPAASARVERWRRIAASACRQCGRARVTEVMPLRGFGDAAAACARADAFLLASLLPAARPLRGVLGELRARRPARVAVMVGPEGDFTPQESEAALAAGAIPVSLGPHTLRVETAALSVLAILGYELGA